MVEFFGVGEDAYCFEEDCDILFCGVGICEVEEEICCEMFHCDDFMRKYGASDAEFRDGRWRES